MLLSLNLSQHWNWIDDAFIHHTSFLYTDFSPHITLSGLCKVSKLTPKSLMIT